MSKILLAVDAHRVKKILAKEGGVKKVVRR